MRKIFVLLFLLISGSILSQNPTYLMNAANNGATINTCGAFFYDSGSNTANYANNLNLTISFASVDVNNTHIKVTFASFNVDASDTLYIYDGPNTNAPLIGKYNNVHPIPPGTSVAATLGNSSGRLTFAFKSNATANAAGWDATVICQQPCQRVIAKLDSAAILPGITDSNYINICIGQQITFVGLGSGAAFPDNDVLYHQDGNTCTYKWDFGDGTTATGRVVTKTYTQVRGYDVQLTVTDHRGCVSSNALGTRVCISRNPIAHVNPLSDYCSRIDSIWVNVGYDPSSVVVVTPIEFVQISSQKFDSTMFIPDGPNCATQCYFTDVSFNSFLPGQTVQSASDILSICVNMEHTFVGDLDFTIICPNGQQAILKTYIHSGGADMGQPNNNDGADKCNPNANPPGVGWNYCWSQIYPTVGTMNSLSGQSQLPATNLTNNTGYYTPDQSFTNLIGCPLNGVWSIKICDNWAIDNGYIFEWTLNLNPNLIPQSWTYQVPIDSFSWSGQYIQQVQDSSVLIVPSQPGTYPYTLTVWDAFGCSYDTTLIAYVVQSPNATLPNDTNLCQGQVLQVCVPDSAQSYLWNTASTTPCINISTTGQYIVRVTNFNPSHTLACTTTDTIKVTVHPNPVVNLGPDLNTCEGNPVTLNAGNPGSNYIWNTGASTQTITTAQSGNYSVTVSQNHANIACYGSDNIQVNIVPQPVVNLGNDTNLCEGQFITLDAGNPGASSFVWSTSANTQTITVSSSGFYSVTVTNSSNGHNCTDRDTINIQVHPLPIVNLGADQYICSGSSATFDAGNPGSSYLWSPGNQTTQTITATQTGYYIVTVTQQHSNIHCSSSDTVMLNVIPLPVVNLGNDTNVCEGTILTLNAGNPGANYIWSTMSTQQYIQVYQSGTYSVTVSQSLGSQTCSGTDSKVVQFFEYPVVNLGNDTCAEAPFTIKTNSTPQPPNYLYHWSNNTNGPTITPTTSGYYQVTVTSGVGSPCSTTDGINVKIIPRPIVNLGPDATLCTFDTLYILTGAQPKPEDYLITWNTAVWPYGDAFGSSIIFGPADPGNYTIVATKKGCTEKSDTINIRVETCDVIIPNVFTPDNDGLNEHFIISGIEHYPNTHVIIYNRWGRKMYESYDYKNDWDAKDAADGVYYYVAIFTKGDLPPAYGTVTVLRNIK